MSRIERRAAAPIPTRHGEFLVVGYEIDECEHVALVRGAVEHRSGVLVRVQSECLTGDVFGSLRCDCAVQLDSALARVAAEGSGVVIYMRGHEGRGIGLMAKLQAYVLQDEGLDTVEANERLGFVADARGYAPAAAILAELEVRSVRLLTNNPAKRADLEAHGVHIEGIVPISVAPNEHNRSYLETKSTRMGHDFGGPSDAHGV